MARKLFNKLTNNRRAIIIAIIIIAGILGLSLLNAKFSSSLETPDNVKLDITGGKAYCVYSNNTLTFKNDNGYNPDSPDNWLMDVVEKATSADEIPYKEKVGDIQTVNFDEQFQHYQPHQLAWLFANCTNLTTINNINYLDTSLVKNYKGMYLSCEKLASADISTFKFSDNLDLTEMFKSCSALKTIYTTTETDLTSNTCTDMFTGDTVLVGGCGTANNGQAVTDKYNNKDGFFTGKGTEITTNFTAPEGAQVSVDIKQGDTTVAQPLVINQGKITVTNSHELNIEQFDVVSSYKIIPSMTDKSYDVIKWQVSYDGGINYIDLESSCNITSNCIVRAVFGEAKAVITTVSSNPKPVDNPVVKFFKGIFGIDDANADANEPLKITFYMDNEDHEGITTYKVPASVDSTKPGWIVDEDIRNNIKEISTDASFIDFKNLVNTQTWFSNCTSLTSFRDIDLSSLSMTKLGSHCFEGCTGFEIIRLPANITEIGQGCFSGCSNLKKFIVEPDGDADPALAQEGSSVGANAFQNCSKLENYVVRAQNGDACEYDENAFTSAGSSDPKVAAPLVLASAANSGLSTLGDFYTYTPIENNSTTDRKALHLDSGKYYYLTHDWNLPEEGYTYKTDADWKTNTCSSDYEVDSKIVFDLNGHNLDKGRSDETKEAIQGGYSMIIQSQHFRLDDSSTFKKADMGSVTGANNINSASGGPSNGPYGGGIIVANYKYFFMGSAADAQENYVQNFNMVNGKISGNKVDTEGAGIEFRTVAKDGGDLTTYKSQTFNMYGGSICDNQIISKTSPYGGAGVKLMWSDTMNMYGGEITNNKMPIPTGDTKGGVGVFLQFAQYFDKGEEMLNTSSHFNMYGGKVVDNKYIDGTSEINTGGIFSNTKGLKSEIYSTFMARMSTFKGVEENDYILEDIGSNNVYEKDSSGNLTLVGFRGSLKGELTIPPTEKHPVIKTANGLEVVNDDTEYPVVAVGTNVDNPSSSLSDYFSEVTELDYKEVADSNLKNIYHYAFAECTKLDNIVVPTSVINVGHNSFKDSAWISSHSLDNIVYDATTNASDRTILAINGNTKDSEKIEFVNTSAQTGQLQARCIASHALENCKNLKYFIVTNPNAAISDNAFNGCTDLNTYLVKLAGNADSVSYSGKPFEGAGNIVRHAPLVVAGGNNTNAANTTYKGGTASNLAYTVLAGNQNQASTYKITANGYYYFTGGYKATSTLTGALFEVQAADCVLDLNSQTLDRNLGEAKTGGSVIWENGEKNATKLRIDDSSTTSTTSTTGKITGGFNNNGSTQNSYGGGVGVYNRVTETYDDKGKVKSTTYPDNPQYLDLLNVNITENNITSEGGGINARSNGREAQAITLNNYRAKIDSNHVTTPAGEWGGAGLKLTAYCSFAMYGGSISNNNFTSAATTGHGAAIHTGETSSNANGKVALNLIAGSITGNKLPGGENGGIYRHIQGSSGFGYLNLLDTFEINDDAIELATEVFTKYHLSDDGTSVSLVSAETYGPAALHVPSSFVGYKVTNIADALCQNNIDIYKINIADPGTDHTLTIGDNAFSGCTNLTTYVAQTTDASRIIYGQDVFVGSGKSSDEIKKAPFVLAGNKTQLNSVKPSSATTYTFVSVPSTTTTLSMTTGNYYMLKGNIKINSGISAAGDCCLDFAGHYINRGLTKATENGYALSFVGSKFRLDDTSVAKSRTFDNTIAMQCGYFTNAYNSSLGNVIFDSASSSTATVDIVNGGAYNNTSTKEGGAFDIRTNNGSLVMNVYDTQLVNNSVAKDGVDKPKSGDIPAGTKYGGGAIKMMGTAETKSSTVNLYGGRITGNFVQNTFSTKYSVYGASIYLESYCTLNFYKGCMAMGNTMKNSAGTAVVGGIVKESTTSCTANFLEGATQNVDYEMDSKHDS